MTTEESDELTVHVSELVFGTTDSQSVRLLQRGFGYAETGNYDAALMAAVRTWQNSHGFEGGRGRQMGREQAKSFFAPAPEITLSDDM